MKKSQEIAVGLFLFVGLGGIAIAMLGLGQSILGSRYLYTIHLSAAEGLIAGGKVTLGGVHIGVVDHIGLDTKHRNVLVAFTVEKLALSWIRKDTIAEIATQGVLGDKYIALSLGEKELLPVGSDIPVRASAEFAHFINKGDHLLTSLSVIARNLEHITSALEKSSLLAHTTQSAKNIETLTNTVNHIASTDIVRTLTTLNKVLDKIDNGSGSLAALLNDPSLYDSVKDLVGGANKNRIMRNLIRTTIQEKSTTP